MLCCLGYFSTQLPVDQPAVEPESVAPPPARVLAYAAPAQAAAPDRVATVAQVVIASPTQAPSPPAPPSISKKLIKVIRSCQTSKAPPFDEARWAREIEKIRTLSKQIGCANIDQDRDNPIRPVMGEDKDTLIVMNHLEEGDIQLGKGASKIAYYAVNLFEERRYVITLFDKKGKSASDIDEARREIEMLKHFKKTPGVVQLENFGEDEDYIAMIMDGSTDSDLGELLNSLQSKKPSLTIEQRLSLALAIARGCATIHSKKVVHRDVKPKNVFITQINGVFHAIIGDFGFACFESDTLTRLDHKGTNGWYSRQFAQFWMKGSYEQPVGENPQADQQLLEITTTQNDMDAVGYILYSLFHPEHKCLPHFANKEPADIFCETAKLLDRNTFRTLLDNIEILYKGTPEAIIFHNCRGILEGILFENWDAATLVARLTELQLALQQRKAAPPAAAPALPPAPAATGSQTAPAPAPLAALVPPPLAAAPQPAPKAAAPTAADLRAYPFGMNPMGMACGPQPI